MLEFLRTFTNRVTFYNLENDMTKEEIVIRTLLGVSSLCIKHAVALIFRFAGLAVHARM